MLGFGDALDGYHDTAGSLRRYLRERAEPAFRETAAEKESLSGQAAFERRRASVREAVVSGIGGLPVVPTEPAVERTGTVAGDDYTIHNLLVETWDDHHVPANCYVPDGDGPFPAALFLCGHVDDPRADADNQRACQELASNGFVVAVADPVCQGERTQYLTDGEAAFTGSGGVSGHCYAGHRAFHAGSTLASYMLHDDRCVLSALLGRPEVDDDRVVALGTSGGGTRAGYLAVIDDRLDALAPCCATTTRREWLKTGQRIDAEQVVPGAIPQGIDYDDFLTGIAPAPICIGAATADRYFPVEGLHEAVERVRRVYELYDAGDRVHLTTAETTHCSVWEVGTEVFEFCCGTLGEGAYEPRDDHTIRDAETLRCTETGRVVDAFADERTIGDLLRADRPASPEAGAVGPDEIRDRVREAFSLDREACPLRPRFPDHPVETPDGLDVQHVWFKTERDPDALVAGVLVSDPAVASTTPAVVCFEDGTTELDDRLSDVRSLAAEHGTILAFDPRGAGAVRNRRLPIHSWVDEYDALYGTEFKLAYDALLLDTSLVALRTFDICRAVAFLRSYTDASAVSVVGEGNGAVHAVYAAAVTEQVARLDVRELGQSFRERTIDPELSFDPSLTAYDVIGRCDVPTVVAALERRGVQVTRS